MQLKRLTCVHIQGVALSQKKLFQECVPIHKICKVIIYVMFWLKKIGFQIERISYHYILHLVIKSPPPMLYLSLFLNL